MALEMMDIQWSYNGTYNGGTAVDATIMECNGRQRSGQDIDPSDACLLHDNRLIGNIVPQSTTALMILRL